MTSHMCYKLKEALFRLKNKDASLTELYLDSKKVGDAGVKKIVKALLRFESNQLKILNLSCSNIGAKGARKVAKLLSSLTKTSMLREIDLSDNNIGDKGAREIAKGLDNKNSTLTHLYLSNNKIRDDGVLEIAKTLASNTTLLGLCLRNNEIGNQTGEAIFDSLKYNSTLGFILLKGSSISETVENKIKMILCDNKSREKNDTIIRPKEMNAFHKPLNESITKGLPIQLKLQIKVLL